MILIASIVLSMLFSCRNSSSNKAANFNSELAVVGDNCKDDLSELSQWISLPDGIKNASWKTVRTGTGELGPSDIILIGILEVGDDLKQMLLSSERIGYRVGVKSSLMNNCIDADILKRFSQSESSNDILIPQDQAYLPGIFEKGSLKRGFFVITGEKTVFLYLISS